MSINYSLYPVPTPRGKESEKRQYWSARVKPSGTKNLKDICKMVSSCTTFNPGEVKGVMDALNQWITIWMSEGYNVNLEGIGILSLALKSENVEDGQGYGLTTCIDGFNFLPSPDLKGAAKKFELKRIKRVQKEMFTSEERKKRIIDYLIKNNSINSSDCMLINNCTKRVALSDLKEMMNAGDLLQIGRGRMLMYIRAYR
ncbi:hypothetical protein [Parabacteroides sp. AM08-6]|uniref:HU family DNA-binding protein n=1 Tax=Parabacteroides sp. AM08-6 TaxID=2292053 RepID=UPI000EFE09BE|nr:hypothetical protein [Parabacteroides sp. AM08-6]RHJ83939.1 hypothetical protein DW103_06515 [Parabacteroides sp. AM08-6]